MDHPDHPDGQPSLERGLGELPFDVRRERDETYEQEVKPMGTPGILTEMPGEPAREIIEPPIMLPSPADVRGQNVALIDTEAAPFGLPAVNFLVQSTYDARPINGNDWRFEDVVALDPAGDPPVTSASVTFTVPPGRIAVLRRISWVTNQLALFAPISATDNGDPDAMAFTSIVFVRLTVSGSIQRTYEKIFRQQSDEDVYVIAAENEKIILTVEENPDFSGTTPNQYGPNFTFYMYGNLLDTRGREKQYEPANEYQGDVLK